MRFFWSRSPEEKAARAAARRQWKIEQAELKLKDAIYNWEHWSFANRPSEDEADKQNIFKLIRRLEAIGGDASSVCWSKYHHWLVEAMPEVYSRELSIRDGGMILTKVGH